jgi:DNA-binding transcriptional regulator YiaG
MGGVNQKGGRDLTNWPSSAAMSPEQCRAARGWLAWTQGKLATKAKVGLSTVKHYESGKRLPMRNNLEAMQKAFEDEGISFTANSVSGRKAIACHP